MFDKNFVKFTLCASLSVGSLPSFAISTAEPGAHPARRETSTQIKESTQDETQRPDSALPPFKTNFLKPTITAQHLDEAIRSVDKMAQNLIDQNKVPGLAISVVQGERIVFAKGYGVREEGKSDKVDADTVFQLASVSKPMASTVVAELVGEGKITWDSRISDLDPAFEMYDPWVTNQITVRDLFCHRSGLPDHAGDDLEDIGYDQAQVLHHLRYQKPDSSFRAGYAYTNFGITEGAVAAAKGYKLSWEDACQEKLYKPLGMTSTSSRYSDFIARENRVHGHVLVDGKWVAKYKRNPDGQAPAASVTSSVNDMSKWMRLQIAGGKYEGKQVIPEIPLDETHKPQILVKYDPINRLPQFYGLGFNVSFDQSGRLILSHSGGFDLGSATCVRMVPDEKIGICVLTNAKPIGVAESLCSTFIDTAIYGKPTQDWLALFTQVFSNPATVGLHNEYNYDKLPTNPTKSLSNLAYVGVYKNDYLGKAEVVDVGGQLNLLVGPNKLSIPLKHYDRDTFTYEMTTEGLFGTHGVRFSVGPDGKASKMALLNLEESGNGWLSRTDLN
jgi:CubicO group peptidase (beta-lactamase class C family)